MKWDDADAVRERLRSFTAFSDISDNELTALAKSCKCVVYNRNRTLIREGTEDANLFILLEGSARVSCTNEDGKEITLDTIFRGDVFGEITFLLGTKRTADVIAIKPCVALILKRGSFDEHSKSFSGFSLMLAKVLARKLTRTSVQLADFAFSDVSHRLLHVLVSLGQTENMKDGVRAVLDPRPTHRELAAMIGTSREVVSRSLKALVRSGSIQVVGRKVIVFKEQMDLIDKTS